MYCIIPFVDFLHGKTRIMWIDVNAARFTRSSDWNVDKLTCTIDELSLLSDVAVSLQLDKVLS